MNDEDRSELVKKAQKDVEDYIANLKPKKYEDGWPEDKWEEEMEKHPIFMSKPLEEGEELPPMVEALQQLKYDPEFNSPIELAMSYKEDGNQNFKRKKYRWAVESYTNALDSKCEDKELNAVLYTNRAIAQFCIGSYRKALKDSTEAKALNPKHLKAFYRGALCCFELREYDNCICWCDEGLQVQSEYKELMDLRKKAEEQKTKVELLEKEAAAKALKEKLEVECINKAVRERGIRFEGKGLTAQSLEPVYPEADCSKVYLTSEGVLVWPVLLLYPEFGFSDYIQAFDEHACFYDHLVAMFSEHPPWDTNREYIPGNLQVYFTDSENALVPVDKMDTLKSVMCHKRFKLKSGTLSFFVTVSKSEFDKSYRSKNS